jgi:PAS domain S-box-containing protein
VYADYYQVSVADIAGAKLSDFLGADVFAREVKPHFDRCLQGEVIEYDLQTEFASKGLVWMHMEYHPYYNEDGEITGVMSHGFDISDRKKVELDL